MARHNVGLFTDERAAQRAVSDLEAAGFDRDQISVRSPDGHAAQQSAASDGGAGGPLSRFGDWLGEELSQLGVGQADAGEHARHVPEGGMLVVVDAQGREDESRRVLLRNGGEDVGGHARGEKPGTYQRPDANMTPQPRNAQDDLFMAAGPLPAGGARSLGGNQATEAPELTFPDEEARLQQREAQDLDPELNPDLSGGDKTALEDQDLLNLR
jgi:hypothetical protein